MPSKLHKTVAMVGMMGAGKTAVGSALAGRLGVPFLDSDAEIEAASTLTIAEIFEREGEAFFRDKEAQVIARLLSGPPVILSTGGGAYLREANRAEISRRGVAVWLDVALDLLWARVRHKTTRPLLRTPDPRATLARLYEERRNHYARADISVRVQPGYSVERTTDAVIEALAARPDVLSAG